MKNSIQIKILTQNDLINSGCFDLEKVIEICENAFVEYAKGGVVFPDKVSVIFDKESQNRINCLPAAILKENVYGMKWVSVFPNNPRDYGLQNLSAVILLSELKNGFPIAFMEGTLCSNLRTGSVGAIAAKYLANESSKTIGFIGAGEQAKSHLLTMKTVMPSLKICKVSSRTSKSEQEFVEQMSKFYPDMKFIKCDSDYEMAVKDSDIIVTAISGQEKILQSEWIKDGAFYCHVGGLEDDFSVAKKADKIVVDNWNVVKHRTQTISQMYNLKLLNDDDIYANLDEIITKVKKGRENEKEFIYFNSVGMSFVDVALANWMYKKCSEKSTGKNITLQSESMFDNILDFLKNH